MVVTPETLSQSEPEPAVDAAEAAVAIAAIEAERDIAIAEIHAETSQASIAATVAETEVIAECQTDLTSLQMQMGELSNQVAEMREAISSLVSAQLMSAAATEVLAEEVSEEALAETAEVISTPQSTEGENSETQTEAISESEGESLPAELKSLAPKLPAVRLV